LLDPSLVLKRGYAWLSNKQGVPVTQVKQLDVGQVVQATLGDGEADMSVISKSVTSK
jgi:exodeoxyribonuclease VII large subunit